MNLELSLTGREEGEREVFANKRKSRAEGQKEGGTERRMEEQKN